MFYIRSLIHHMVVK